MARTQLAETCNQLSFSTAVPAFRTGGTEYKQTDYTRMLYLLLLLLNMESTTNELKKIILVDDDEDLLFTFNYWLMNKGFTTIALTDANSIDSFIDNFQPSLILIDIHLKNKDGREICRYIKKDLKYNVPVLLYSSHNHSETDYWESGADGFFQKSSDHLSMIHYISRFL